MMGLSIYEFYIRGITTMPFAVSIVGGEGVPAGNAERLPLYVIRV